MKEKEALKNLIDNPKQPNVSEWVYEVEAFLDEINESNEEAWILIDGIKKQGDAFQRCENLVALLRHSITSIPSNSCGTKKITPSARKMKTTACCRLVFLNRY